MMASNLLSRLLPPTNGPASVYETLRDFDQTSEASDIEARAGMTALDEEDLDDHFHDDELQDSPDGALGSPLRELQLSPKRRKTKYTQGQEGVRNSRGVDVEDHDDDVPQSLLVEDDQDGGNPATPGETQWNPIQHPIPGVATTSARARWRTTQEQQRLHQDNGPQSRLPRSFAGRIPTLALIDPKEKAMWRWANVQNLDNFLRDVYRYFHGNGIWCIMLSRLLDLLTLAFVVGFGIFLSSCIDYKKVPGSKTTSEILIPQCTKKMSRTANLLIWLFVFLWFFKAFQYILDIRRLRHMHAFYHHLLDIPDNDMQTISWQEVVKRLMGLRDQNPSTAANISERHRRFMGSQSKQRMDAHDIANRLMRRDNYLIALVNKDILDLTLPIPFFRNRQLFSKTLEWNLSLCILDFVFDQRGQVQPEFLKDSQRRALSDALRRRFLFAGFMNVVCAPFIVIYFIVFYFFRNFTEYQKNPSQLGSRQYTPLAEWKFREFNELWHLFHRRINMSYPFASRYIDQFPKDKTVQAFRFVAFITGALASVLAVASVVDPDLFLGFEITHDRTVLFYLGVLGTVWAIARGAVPEENLVFDPEYALSNVTDYTHYLPAHWRGRLHSDEVRKEFSLFYQMKVVIFLEEILSLIFTPFVLWFSLPKCSDRLIDFFREFTVHVDGLGYVCSFAVFDFKKGGSNLAQPVVPGKNGADFREEYYSTKDGKMLASYYGFIDNYVTNPKAGTPYLHPSNRKQFHPPPAFPGLASSSLNPEGYGMASGRDRQQHGTARHTYLGLSNGPHSVPRTPRYRPAANHQPSPISSILLDPQHQPPQTNLRKIAKPAPRSRLKASKLPFENPIEDDEEDHHEIEVLSAADGSAGATGDSNLGDSWKTTQAGAIDDDADEGIQAAAGDKGPGVLGLVYQFSKARTEGQGVGVGI